MNLTTFEAGNLDTACTIFSLFVDGCVKTVVTGLRHGVDGLIVSGVVPLVIGGLMPLFSSPGVLHGGPGAVALNSDVVGASADAEETILTPVGAPRVTDQPVWAAVLLTVADDGDVVDDVQVTGVITVDTTSVVVKGLRHGNTASNGTSLVDLLLHVLLANDLAELFDIVGHVLVGDEASLTWVTVTADVHGGASLSD